jgi:ribonucleoside-diphosphate reductase alpha chain
LYSAEQIIQLNKDIEQFPNVFKIESHMKNTHEGISRLVMLDRYSFKDTEQLTLSEGDIVVLTVKHDPKYPARGIGNIAELDKVSRVAKIKVEEEFHGNLEGIELETGIIERSFDEIEKPLELYYEQINIRNAAGLSSVEETEQKRLDSFDLFYDQLSKQNIVPAGRVLYGAGSGTDVTYFNCYVMPFVKDSREGISDHRKTVMEIMSRGGGVGTNGSTLRPKNELARGVNGKSSGSVSWLDDIAKLTNLVEQGGSRRGAQMIMLNDWHPDIYEFIISKMQNPRILRYIIKNIKDDQIKILAKNKLKFTPLTETERKMCEFIQNEHHEETPVRKEALNLLKDGGRYSVNDPEFLTGANISVCFSHEFMAAVESDSIYDLKFPDVSSYDEEEMNYYNNHWHECGDIREWEKEHKMRVKVYRTIKAKDLWNLVNVCATYSAEPGIFFLDAANDMTNAKAYGQKVVATNPCGEQPLAPFSVCNLSAVNLSNFEKGKKLDEEELEKTVRVSIRMQDNVIDATPYFLEENKKQALGERRIGLGVMGLHDLLIKCELVYGSEEGNKMVDRVFEIMSHAAYRESIELAKEKGSFPFLDDKFDKGNRRKFINTGYMRKMPEDIRQDILKYGIRNSHLLTVAPTGSTGTMIGCSTGLEPYFSFSYYRSGRLGKFIPVVSDLAKKWLEGNGYEGTIENMDKLPEWFIGTMDLPPESHVDVQNIIQNRVDSSISKTVNAPKGYTVSQVEEVYERLYAGGAKGGTVYVDGSRDSQVLSLTNEENNLDEVDAEPEEKKIPVVLEVVKPLRETDQEIGSEVGNTCPVCRKGTVVDAGGCATCNNCNAQLKCGL